MTPKQLATAAFAFGEVLEILPRDRLPDLHKLFKVFEKSGLQSIHLYSLDEINSFLTSYARWHINVDPQTLAAFLRRASQLCDGVTSGSARSLLVSISVLAVRCRNMPSEASTLAQQIAPFAFQKVDASSIVKVVIAMDALHVPTVHWLGSTSSLFCLLSFARLPFLFPWNLGIGCSCVIKVHSLGMPPSSILQWLSEARSRV